MGDGTVAAPIALDSADTSRPRAWWGVGVLVVFYLFAFVDRQILALLVVPIRRELGVTEIEYSLLQGLSFATFYTLLGVPLARLADAWDRRALVAIGACVWSAMTIACGLASSYGELFLARVGVGVGEAALSPAAYAWIAASFPRERRGSAFGVYSMGIYLGSGLAFVLGGAMVELAAQNDGVVLPLVGSLRAWQTALVGAGVLGILATPLAFTLREPRRARDAAVPRLAELFAWMKRHRRAFLGHHAGFALLALSGYAVNLTVPSFLQRRHGMALGEASLAYGLVLGVAGALGVACGGLVADRVRARGARRASDATLGAASDASIRVGLAAALVGVPFAAAFPLVESASACLALLVPLSFATAAGFGVAAAGVVELAPTALRGRASAIYLFAISLVGLGLGPTAPPWFAKHVLGSETELPLALSLVATIAGLGSAAFLASGLRAHRACVEELAR